MAERGSLIPEEFEGIIKNGKQLEFKSKAGGKTIGHIFPCSLENDETFKEAIGAIPKIQITELYPQPMSWLVDIWGILKEYFKDKDKTDNSKEGVLQTGKKLIGDVWNKIKGYDGVKQIRAFARDCKKGNVYLIPCNAKNTSYGTDGNAGWGGLGFGAIGDALSKVSDWGGELGFNAGLKLFTYPTWTVPSQGYRWSMTLDVTLFNTSETQAKDNTTLTDTMVAHNRWIQHSIFCLPGAIYALVLPSGQKNALCAADITVSGDGVMRKVKDIFIVPDVYIYKANFKSIIDDNYNTMDKGLAVDGSGGSGTGGSVSRSQSTEIPREFDDRIRAINSMTEAATKVLAARGNVDVFADTSTDDNSLYQNFSRLYQDTAKKIGLEEQTSLATRLDQVEEEISKNQETIDSIRKQIVPGIPMDEVRQLNVQLREVESRMEALEVERRDVGERLVDAEMSFIVQMNEAANKRAARDEPIECPESYFSLPKISEDEVRRIKYMTRAEKEAYVSEQKQILQDNDQWGIAECSDILPRLCVASYIIDVILEIGNRADEIEYENETLFNEYKYKCEMLEEDLNTTLNPEIPFVLNKTNVVYVPASYIPKEWSESSESSESSSEIEQDANSSSSTEIQLIGNAELTEAEKQELLVLRRNEIVKREFGGDGEFTKAAFRYIVSKSEEAKTIKNALVELKTHTEGTAILLSNGEFTLSKEIVVGYNGTTPILETPVYSSREIAIDELTRIMFLYIRETKEATLNNAINSSEEEAQRLITGIKQHLLA